MKVAPKMQNRPAKSFFFFAGGKLAQSSGVIMLTVPVVVSIEMNVIFYFQRVKRIANISV